MVGVWRRCGRGEVGYGRRVVGCDRGVVKAGAPFHISLGGQAMFGGPPPGGGPPRNSSKDFFC